MEKRSIIIMICVALVACFFVHYIDSKAAETGRDIAYNEGYVKAMEEVLDEIPLNEESTYIVEEKQTDAQHTLQLIQNGR